MKRIILDTNIYGLILKDPERLEVVELMKTKSKMTIYGFKVIRNELRDVPKLIKVQQRSLRIDLLNLYDSIVEDHLLDFNAQVTKIAENYYKAFREFGGTKSKEEIIDDFMIVSAASLNNLDIVVSNDEKSMSNESALRAYNLINSVLNKRTPKFIMYNQFKNLLRGESNELF